MAEVPRTIGRYALHTALARGGMATVHLARLLGPVGFSRTVAIKRLHASFAQDPEFVSMFLDEARLAARIRHPNVVPVLDVVALDGELFLVMEYVQGESLARLLRGFSRPIPVPIAARIAVDMLNGLHAAHEAKNERSEPLDIVHRDVSPHNILVGVDGIARVTDFGIAKAANRIQTTREGQLKGKLAYMAPEQLLEQPVDRRTDVYAASVVIWEALTGKRLFARDDPGATITRILQGQIAPPSSVAADVPAEVDEIVARGLTRESRDRFANAQEMALAIEHAVRLEPAARVGQWVAQVAATSLAERARAAAELETGSHGDAAGEIARAVTRDAEPETEDASSVASSSNSVAQVSSLTVARPRQTSRTPLIVIAGVIGAAALALIVATVWRTPAQAEDATASAPNAAPTAVPASAPSSTSPATAEPAASTSADSPSAPASAAASAPASASAAPEPPRPVVQRPGPRPAPKPAATPTPTEKKPGDFSSLTRE